MKNTPLAFTRSILLLALLRVTAQFAVGPKKIPDSGYGGSGRRGQHAIIA